MDNDLNSEQNHRPWTWIVAALLLVLLGGFLYRSRSRKEEPPSSIPIGTSASVPAPKSVPTSNAAQPANSVEAVAPVTGIGQYLDAQDKSALAGRSAMFGSVNVQRVLSDRAFTVGPTIDQELLVLMDSRLSEGPIEQRLRVEKGQQLMVSGVMEKPPTPEIQRDRYRGLNAPEMQLMDTKRIYLHATAVQKAL